MMILLDGYKEYQLIEEDERRVCTAPRTMRLSVASVETMTP
jgi:hypothetical protein